MERIDRLGWTAGFSFDACGADFAVRSNCKEAVERARGLLLPDWRLTRRRKVYSLYSLRMGPPPERPGVRNFHLLYEFARRIARTLDPDEIFSDLARALDSMVAQRAVGRYFLHAGVVRWRERAIVLPGLSGSGTTRLVCALAERGAEIYSDKFAVFDGEGRVYSYPRSILSPCGVELAIRARAPGLPVGCVLFTNYRPQGCFRPRPLPHPLSGLELLKYAAAMRVRSAEVMSALMALSGTTPCFRSCRGEAADSVARILRLAESLHRRLSPGLTG